jgi:hypothetical protein
MIKLTPKIIITRILLIGLVVAVFAAVAIYYKNTVFA